MTGRLYVGCSGWSYKDWRERFYPRDVPQRRWLEYYAGQFDCVEINSTFYRLPQEKTVRGWAERVPEGFIYAIKVWRMISHQKKLADCAEQWEKFLAVTDAFGDSGGPYLLQLPPTLKPDPGRLEAALDAVHRHDSSRYLAVEFRHPAWYRDDIQSLLDRYGAALCLHDMAGSEAETPNEASGFVYKRYHGSEGDYSGGYPDERLQADAGQIRGWLDAGLTVYVFFNNDIAAWAPHNARTLKSLVEKAS